MTLEELEKQLDKWGNAREEIISKRDSRDWGKLPDSFEYEAIAALFISIKWRFSKHNIKSRVLASKAMTFDDLISSVELAQKEDNKRK